MRSSSRARERVWIGILAMAALFARDVAAENGWTRVRSDSFVATGQASEAELRRTIADLEAFRGAMSVAFPALRLRPRVPTSIVIFEEPAFQRFLPRDAQGRKTPNIGGYFLSDPDANFIVFRAQAPATDRRTVLHEYAHYVLHRNLPALPMWLSEGLADLYSTLERDPKTGRVLLGRPPDGYLTTLRTARLVPLKEIVARGVTREMWNDPDRVQLFYAESWAVVHHLVIGRGREGQARIAAYVEGLGRAETMDQAFKQAFGKSVNAVDQDVFEYVRLNALPGASVDPPVTSVATVVSEPVSAADVAYVEGDLLLRVGAVPEAEQSLTSALRLDRAHAGARLAMARVRSAQARWTEAFATLRSVADDQPENFAAQYYLGQLLARCRRYDEALVAYRAAARVRDDSAPTWFALSSMAVAVGALDEADAALARAMRIEFDPESYRSRAVSALGLGRNTTAIADAARYIDAVGWTAPSAQTIAFVAAIAHWRERQTGDADAILQRVRAIVPSSSWTGAVVQFMQGRISTERLLARAKDAVQRTEAHTYAGFKASIEGRRDEALRHFQWVREQGVRGEIATLAGEEMLRLETEAQK